MRIKSERHTVQHKEVNLVYDVQDKWGDSSYWFPCDEDGVVDVAALNDAAKLNWQKCQTGFDGPRGASLSEPRVRVNRWSTTESAVGECECCGNDVYLDGFTNTCDCGADYNMSGQLLGPRSQWGEETGESLADILRGGYEL